MSESCEVLPTKLGVLSAMIRVEGSGIELTAAIAQDRAVDNRCVGQTHKLQTNQTTTITRRPRRGLGLIIWTLVPYIILLLRVSSQVQATEPVSEVHVLGLRLGSGLRVYTSPNLC